MKDVIVLETIRKIHLSEEGACIEVGQDEDLLGCVEIRTADQKSKDYFGVIRLTMSPDTAKAVAEAILKLANELEEQEKQAKLRGAR